MVVKMVLVGECMCLCKRMRIMKIFVIKVKNIRYIYWSDVIFGICLFFFFGELL